MPAATIASMPFSARSATGRMQPPSSWGGLSMTLTAPSSPFSTSTTVKQSQWPKWPERSQSRPPLPRVGMATFMGLSLRGARRVPRPS